MGPGLFSPDDADRPAFVTPTPDAASMGPGLFSPDDLVTRVAAAARVAGFNGAGLVQPG